MSGRHTFIHADIHRDTHTPIHTYIPAYIQAYIHPARHTYRGVGCLSSVVVVLLCFSQPHELYVMCGGQTICICGCYARGYISSKWIPGRLTPPSRCVVCLVNMCSLPHPYSRQMGVALWQTQRDIQRHPETYRDTKNRQAYKHTGNTGIHTYIHTFIHT